MEKFEELSSLDKTTAMDLTYWSAVVPTREYASTVLYPYVPYAEVAKELGEDQPLPEQPQVSGQAPPLSYREMPPTLEGPATLRNIGRLIMESTLYNLREVKEYFFPDL